MEASMDWRGRPADGSAEALCRSVDFAEWTRSFSSRARFCFRRRAGTRAVEVRAPSFAHERPAPAASWTRCSSRATSSVSWRIRALLDHRRGHVVTDLPLTSPSAGDRSVDGTPVEPGTRRATGARLPACGTGSRRLRGCGRGLVLRRVADESRRRRSRCAFSEVSAPATRGGFAARWWLARARGSSVSRSETALGSNDDHRSRSLEG